MNIIIDDISSTKIKKNHTFIIGAVKNKNNIYSLNLSNSFNTIKKIFNIDMQNCKYEIFVMKFLEYIVIKPLDIKYFKNIVLLCLDNHNTFHHDDYRKIGNTCIEIIKKLQINKASILLDIHDLYKNNDCIQMIAEGLYLGNYVFNKYKTNIITSKLINIEILINKLTTKNKIYFNKGCIIAKNINIAKDLINEPANILTPKYFSTITKKLINKLHIDMESFNIKDLKKMNLNLLTSVGQGSSKLSLPCLIKLQYIPHNIINNKTIKHICLIGKGVTFDSGGLDLKPSPHMLNMKSDMSGAASVLGTMLNVAHIKPNIKVTGYLVCVENSIGPKSYKPGDVIFSKKGISVEVNNTDAEGRLILADILTLAEEEKKYDYILDIATLTGACHVALGSNSAGIFSRSKFLIESLCKYADISGESFWHMPLISKLSEQLKSNIADIKNCGNSYGGAITAGLFLEKFIDNKDKWCHIDIAGAAFSDKKTSYKPIGGIGFGVRTLTEFILNI